ncbi:MAG: CIA30 family protein [Pseudomonadota bacterium]
MAETDSCVVVLEHVQGETDYPWRTVNDGVMGGLSDGGSVLENGTLTFSGNTNTNGGGFSPSVYLCYQAQWRTQIG